MIQILYLHAGAEMYGADKVLLELVKGLDKTKYNPSVVLPCGGPLVEALTAAGIETQVVPYPILRRKYFNPAGLIMYIFCYFRYSREVLRIARRKKADLLHINTSAVLEGIYLKRKLGIPLVWHVHEIVADPRIMYRFLCRLIGAYADIVVVVSNAVGRHLISSRSIRTDQIRTIYNGVDNNVFSPGHETDYLRKEFGMPADAFVIGMIGRVNAKKGQGDFLLAVEPILKKHEHVYAVMVGGAFQGEEWRLEELKSRIEACAYHDRIILKDFRTDTPSLYNLFDIFLLPSIHPEAFPTVVLEAMACGKPVVGYDLGGFREMAVDRETAFLTKACCPEALSAKIEELINDKALCASMGRAALKRQKAKFSVQNYLDSFSALYSNMSLRNEGHGHAANA